MFKAIIADDERKICQLILALGHWPELCIEVVEVCNDGESTLENIILHKPDIVITDIRMPIFDGLDIIAKTKEHGIDTCFIIVSGYKHFEYAHSAMKFGIVDYLLKPIDETQLNEALSKTCKNISRQKQFEDENTVLLRRRFITEILDTNHSFPHSIQALNEKYAFHFQSGLFKTLFVNTDNPDLHRENALFIEKVSVMFTKIFSFCYEKVAIQTEQGIFCFLNFSERESAKIKLLLNAFFYEIKVLTDIYGDFSLTIGVGETVDDLSLTKQSMAKAITAQRAKLLFGTDRVIDSSACYLENSDLSLLVPNTRFRKLYTDLEAMNLEAIKEWFYCFQNLVIIPDKTNPNMLYELRDMIMKQLSVYIKEYAVNEEELLGTMIAGTDRAKSFADMMDLLRESFLAFVKTRLDERSTTEIRPVRQAKQYIAEHYADDVSLEKIAEIAALNPSYLSNVFKKHSGLTITEYITEIRIENAKKLLRTTNQSVIDIGCHIGYFDDKYFRKLFKKQVGIKPSEYRKLYS